MGPTGRRRKIQQQHCAPQEAEPEPEAEAEPVTMVEEEEEEEEEPLLNKPPEPETNWVVNHITSNSKQTQVNRFESLHCIQTGFKGPSLWIAT